MTRTHGSMAEPPEGVTAGETVPVESEPDEIDRALIEDVMGVLKTRGEPYTMMNDTELEQKAVETIREHGVAL